LDGFDDSIRNIMNLQGDFRIAPDAILPVLERVGEA